MIIVTKPLLENSTIQKKTNLSLSQILLNV